MFFFLSFYVVTSEVACTPNGTESPKTSSLMHPKGKTFLKGLGFRAQSLGFRVFKQCRHGQVVSLGRETAGDAGWNAEAWTPKGRFSGDYPNSLSPIPSTIRSFTGRPLHRNRGLSILAFANDTLGLEFAVFWSLGLMRTGLCSGLCG